MNGYGKFAVASFASALIAAGAANAGGEPAWLKALPDDWAPLARQLCNTPLSHRGFEGIYVSEYAGNRKILAIDAAGEYRFASYVDTRSTLTVQPALRLEARDAGRAKIAGGFVTLVPDQPTARTSEDQPTSMWHEFRLLILDYAATRLLVAEDRLDDVGAMVQWNGHLGRSDSFYRRMRCADLPLDSAGTDGPDAPPWHALPPALRQWTFEKPVHATIIELLRDASVDEDEVLVRIDKGKADRFRINMPLCSGTRAAGVHGWVGDVAEHSSTFRVQLPDPRPPDIKRFVALGTRLSTSASSCREPK